MSITSLQSADSSSQGARRPSTAQDLVALALEEFDLCVDVDGKPYGIPKTGHVARPLTGTADSVRRQLGGLLRRRTGRVASQNALTQAIAMLEYEADQTLHREGFKQRVARTGHAELYVDLGDAQNRAIHLSSAGWRVLGAGERAPAQFKRSKLTAPLPEPARGGSLEGLWEFANFPSAADRELIAGWLVAAMLLEGSPVPILALFGERGTAKTCSARYLFALFDPTVGAVRRPPTDISHLMHAGANSRGVILDNLSAIPRWMSDGMCRYVTGEADVNRSLYFDDEVRVIRTQGVMCFTSIDAGPLADDLAERCLWLELAAIPPESRRPEFELERAWAREYPGLVGALLDLTVLVLQQLPHVSLASKPRMADFAEVLAALDLATGSRSLERYLQIQAVGTLDAIQADPFITELANRVTATWVGTGKQLHRLLVRPGDAREWPEARGIAAKLRRIAPDLRKIGWIIEEIPPPPGVHVAKQWRLVPPKREIVS